MQGQEIYRDHDHSLCLNALVVIKALLQLCDQKRTKTQKIPVANTLFEVLYTCPTLLNFHKKFKDTVKDKCLEFISGEDLDFAKKAYQTFFANDQLSYNKAISTYKEKQKKLEHIKLLFLKKETIEQDTTSSDDEESLLMQ